MSTEKPILTVSQLTQAVKHQLESTFPNLKVQGEISNFKRQSSGHLYFSIKDDDAQLSCVMFRNAASGLRQLPKEGDQVILTGALNVYPPRGGYQLVVRSLELAGLGELLIRLEQLKRDIARRGWFKPEHKQALPACPRRIGIITSPTGAALQDILNVLRRRLNSFHITVNPVRVQGAEAPGEIAAAIREMNTYDLCDVMIVGRGGGSIEDLWAFNEEIVATAVHESRIPIVCAVGHETDHTIAEYVADVRAPTPSAAAEIVAKESGQYLQHLQQIERRLQHGLRAMLQQGRSRLTGLLRHPIWQHSDELLGPHLLRLDELREEIDRDVHDRLKSSRLRLESFARQSHSLNPLATIRRQKERLQGLSKHLEERIQSILLLHSERLRATISQLQAIDPKNLLKKGYSLVQTEAGEVVTGCGMLHPEQAVRILFADGAATAEVRSTHPESNQKEMELTSP